VSRFRTKREILLTRNVAVRRDIAPSTGNGWIIGLGLFGSRSQLLELEKAAINCDPGNFVVFEKPYLGTPFKSLE